MSSKAFYVQQLKKLHTRYGLSKKAVTLLKALDDYHLGSLDEAELGRMVRLSQGMRKAVTDTIAKCAAVMEKKPEELKDCAALIKNCTEILAIADEPPSVQGMSFMKFPREIREMIYKHYTRRHTYLATPPPLMPQHKKGSCHCPETTLWPGQPPSWALAFASKMVKDEFLSYFYSRNVFHFSCPCEMQLHLNSNQLLKERIQAVQVHWRGPASDKAFLTLGTCPKLDKLTLVISKSTTMHLSSRQQLMNTYFASARPTRLTDALGLDELLEIRGVHQVKVIHANAKHAGRRTDEDKHNLQSLLGAKLQLASVSLFFRPSPEGDRTADIPTLQ